MELYARGNAVDLASCLLLNETTSLDQRVYNSSSIASSCAWRSSQLLLNIRSPPRGNEGGDSTWLLPLDEMDAEDRAALMDGPEFLFADESRCLVYCDFYLASREKQ